MGLRFNADKTEIYWWSQHHVPATLEWQGQSQPIQQHILTYLGHVPPPLAIPPQGGNCHLDNSFSRCAPLFFLCWCPLLALYGQRLPVGFGDRVMCLMISCTSPVTFARRTKFQNI